MAYSPLALITPQYDEHPLWWLKAYYEGTTTPLAMATDATGGTTVAKFKLDLDGFPVTAGDARIIPFVDGDYDLWLFPTAAEADANDTTNAIQMADDLNADPFSERDVTADSLASLIAMEIPTGDANVYVIGRTSAGDGYEGMFIWLSTDQSANVALDPYQGWIVAPASDVSGASGAWKREGQLEANVVHFGAVGDGVADDTIAIQTAIDMIDSRGGGVVHVPYSSTGYLISSSLVFPVNVSLIGDPFTKIIPESTGSFTGGFMMLVNSTDAATWVIAYPNIPRGEIRNIVFDNSANPATVVRGIFLGAAFRIVGVRTRYMHQTIKTVATYLDFVHLDTVYSDYSTGSDYMIDVQMLGDALTITSCHLTAYSTTPNLNHVSVTGCLGGIVSNTIGGNLYFKDCLATKCITSHLETGNIQCVDSSMSFEDNYIWASSSPGITFTSSNASGHTCTVKNLQRIFHLGDEPASYDIYDIKTHPYTNIIVEGCCKHTSQQGAITIGETSGILVKDSTDTPIDAWNNYSYFLSQNGVIGNNENIWLDHAHDMGTGLIYTLGSVQSSNKITWSLATATYYYQIQFLYDPIRMIGEDNANAEASVALTNGGNGGLIPFGVNSRNRNSMVRLYRGTATGSYDYYVDIPMIGGYNLYDDGSTVNGFTWTSRTAGAVDALTASGLSLQWKGDRFELWRSAAPTAAVGTFNHGDQVTNTAPTSSGFIGWVCTSAGSPGTWVTWGATS